MADELVMTLDDYRGLSAYEIAVENGFEGTQEEWLNSLQGVDGKTNSVNHIQQVDGNIQLTGADIPLSTADSRTLPELAAGMDTILAAMSITDEAVDFNGRYIDNALFR